MIDSLYQHLSAFCWAPRRRRRAGQLTGEGKRDRDEQESFFVTACLMSPYQSSRRQQRRSLVCLPGSPFQSHRSHRECDDSSSGKRYCRSRENVVGFYSTLPQPGRHLGNEGAAASKWGGERICVYANVLGLRKIDIWLPLSASTSS